MVLSPSQSLYFFTCQLEGRTFPLLLAGFLALHDHVSIKTKSTRAVYHILVYILYSTFLILNTISYLPPRSKGVKSYHPIGLSILDCYKVNALLVLSCKELLPFRLSPKDTSANTVQVSLSDSYCSAVVLGGSREDESNSQLVSNILLV